MHFKPFTSSRRTNDDLTSQHNLQIFRQLHIKSYDDGGFRYVEAHNAKAQTCGSAGVASRGRRVSSGVVGLYDGH